ncbi:sporulation protein YunB [Bacillus cereus]|uniref:sporulation protein YunB n=1 Tax=unclassified Bacillus (in: firmicutes) TaxID=185979 RepID=UPI0008956849|nr:MULTISPECIES: sporulation protein YunB [unclassified Bacillus (in: firmicutes)]PFE04787.1 sporulation protein YunB [Bacillus sp. AFS023182]PGX96044.1 sporulation protein YunB [Bacillus cereus]SDZ31391.1 sporulation protein YunB [Bacillus sp. 166amftsu]
MRTFRPKASRFRKGPLPFRHVLLISFILFLLLTLQGFWIVNKSIQPTLIKYGEMQTHKMATVVMTKAVKDRINEGFDVDSLMKVQNDKNGKVSTIDLNTKQVNEILTSTTAYIEKYLHQVEKGDMKALGLPEESGVSMSVPLGRITDNALLGNLGPDIPIDFTTIGHVSTDIKQNVKPHGINNTAIEVVMEVNVTLQVIIPFRTKEITVKQNIPIATRIVQGEVPSYYGSGGVFVPDSKGKKADE